MLLQDKIAVVTGANRGLGKAVALRFAEEGAKVMLVKQKAALRKCSVRM